MDEQAQFLAWLMERTSFTQVELAQQLGISASLVSRLARGERRLTLSMLRQIADVFGLSQAEVFTRAGVMEGPVLLEEAAPSQMAARLESRCAPPEEPEDMIRLRTLLEQLRDPRRALTWALEGKLPGRTIDKLARLVELELEYRDTPGEG
jgi:transcriptional regulator with XRE-family HTH domain